MSAEILHHQSAHAAEHEHHDAGGNSVFGFWIYLMSDCILFATLFATYAVLSGSFAGDQPVRISLSYRMCWLKPSVCCSVA